MADKDNRNGWFVRLVASVGGGLIVIAAVGLLSLAQTVAVQGAAIESEARRADDSAVELKVLRECVAEIKTDVKLIKSDVADIKDDVREVRTSLRRSRETAERTKL